MSIGENHLSSAEEEAAMVLSGEALLCRDTIPDKNQSLNCQSCGTRYVGVFCHKCGQKNDDMRRSMFSLIIDMVGNLTAIDSRIWRSWIKLLTRPGKVAREYADGSRTKWTSPVRAYLAMSILLFGYIAITGTQILSVTMDVKREADAPQSISELELSDLKPNFEILLFETKENLEAKREAANSDLVNFILNYPAPLTVTLDDSGSIKFAELEKTDNAELDTVFRINGETLTAEETSNRSVTALKLLLSQPETLNGYFATYLPRIMLVMMPFTMFLGIVFIRGRGNALLYDHLVHTAYIHAVFFFLLLLGLILAQFTPIPTHILLWLLTLYMLLYLPMSLGGMFKRGPIKTIWSSYAIGFIYFIIMTLVLLGMTVYVFVNLIQQASISAFNY